MTEMRQVTISGEYEPICEHCGETLGEEEARVIVASEIGNPSEWFLTVWHPGCYDNIVG